jgi:hypothetical protein
VKRDSAERERGRGRGRGREREGEQCVLVSTLACCHKNIWGTIEIWESNSWPNFFLTKHQR